MAVNDAIISRRSGRVAVSGVSCSNAPMPALVASVEQVTVVVSGRRILGPLSFTLRADEHWAVLGPNGAGKTTLLSLIGAERHPSSGKVMIFDEQVGRTDLRALRRRIAVVGHHVSDRLPRHPAAVEIVLTGKDGLLAPWWGRFDSHDHAEALGLLERLRCGHLAEQPFGRCSQGERQRILLARALFGHHDLLLLDEPALGVDLPGREALILALDEIASDPAGPATVEVAHTLEELPSSTTHALLLADGVAVASGPADEVLVDEKVSACYGIEVRVTRSEGRYSARASGAW